MSMFGARNYPALTKELFVDFLNGFFVRPVMNLDKIFVVSAKGVKEKGGRKLGWRILLGFLVCIPVLAVIIALLSSADKAFESLVRKIGDIIGHRILEYLFKIFLGAVLAVPLFGAVYSFRYKNGRPDAKAVTLPAKLDPAVAYTVLSLVCAVYFVFLFVQFNYMFLAFAGRLPENFIYSEYARRGFFELAAVAAINLAISAAAYVFSPKKSGKPAAAGAGMLAQSRQEVFLRWNRVTKVKYKPKSRTILLRGGWTEQLALFCADESYPQIEHEVMLRTAHLEKGSAER